MYDINIKSFCENLKAFRRSRQITLEMLGEKINKTKATVSKYEKGEIVPDFITILEICNSLNISVSQLFPVNEQEENMSLDSFIPINVNNSKEESFISRSNNKINITINGFNINISINDLKELLK